MKKYVFLAFILIFGTSILSGSMTYQKTNQKNNETNPQTVAENVENLISETSSDEQIVEEVNEEIISDELEEIETPSVIEDKAEEIKTTISTPKIVDTKKQVVAEVKQEVKIENNNNTPQTKEETIQTIPEAPKQEVVIEQPVIVGEEYKTNDTMINTIRNVINSNQSEDMKLYGYNIVVDNSIVDVTSQFTYTEQRVIDKIKYKFGTIRIYARDYYNNGQYICTQCYII
jgi:hypothetical protein